jgi:transcription-repair coupling factor (superfamily II helicase)
MMDRTEKSMEAAAGTDSGMESRVTDHAATELDLEALTSRGCEADLHLPALLPEDYLPDVHARLVLYKRIATAADDHELLLLKEELIDRLGPCTQAVHNLFRLSSLKLRADALGIKRLDFSRQGGLLEFRPKPEVDPVKVIKLIQTDRHYRLDGQDKLRLRKDLPEDEMRFKELESVLERLT